MLLYDSEDYHTGRAAAYHTAVHLLGGRRPVAEVRAELERLQLAAEEEANRKALAARPAKQ